MIYKLLTFFLIISIAQHPHQLSNYFVPKTPMLSWSLSDPCAGILIVLPCGSWVHMPVTGRATTQLHSGSRPLGNIRKLHSWTVSSNIDPHRRQLSQSFSKMPTLFSRECLIVFVKGVPSEPSWSIIHIVKG